MSCPSAVDHDTVFRTESSSPVERRREGGEPTLAGSDGDEGRLSIVELAEQIGHNPTMCISTYAHVMVELRGAPKASAQEQIRAA
jgi:hypothetical protein